MRTLRLLLAVVALAAYASTAQANLLDDGGFENSTPNTQTSGSDWVVTNNSGDPNDVNHGGIFTDGGWGIKEGARGWWFQSFQGPNDPNAGPAVDADVSQTIVAPTSGTYDLRYWSAREANVQADSMTATLSCVGTCAGGTSASIDMLAASYINTENFNQGGTPFAITLPNVSAGDVLTVSFTMVGGRDSAANPQSLMIDKVSLTVPEPTSVALAGFGLLGVLGLRRRRT